MDGPQHLPDARCRQLEEGAVLLPIEDPRHGATAAVAAVVAFAAEQIPAQLRGSPDAVWGRVNLFRHALQSVLRTGEATLTPEDFVGWTRLQPRTRDIAEATPCKGSCARPSTWILRRWRTDARRRIGLVPVSLLELQF